jgi:hypothetical protein
MAIRRAKDWYESFRERPANRARRVTVDIPRSVAVMGYLDAVHYSTTHGRRAVRYKHKFHPGSKPLLCTDGKVLVIVAGRYHVTDRGIVDLSPQGDEIE